MPPGLIGSPPLFRAENVQLKDGKLCVTVGELDVPVIAGHQGKLEAVHCLKEPNRVVPGVDLRRHRHLRGAPALEHKHLWNLLI